MNSLVIPPPPNWYETSILACAPDNTLIYGSRNDIIVIDDSPNDQPANVRIIPKAHAQKIISVNINKSWDQPNQLLVTVAEDKIVKLWNVKTLQRKLAHKEHVSHNRVVGATFAGDERVISVSEDGVIIVWNVSLDQTTLLKDILGFKVTITCISTCPHATWLTAFGLKNGLVLVTDLRKEGKLLYKLRGHDKSVISLAWCPAPINIFPRNPLNYVGSKKVTTPIVNGYGKQNGDNKAIVECDKNSSENDSPASDHLSSENPLNHVGSKGVTTPFINGYGQQNGDKAFVECDKNSSENNCPAPDNIFPHVVLNIINGCYEQNGDNKPLVECDKNNSENNCESEDMTSKGSEPESDMSFNNENSKTVNDDPDKDNSNSSHADDEECQNLDINISKTEKQSVNDDEVITKQKKFKKSKKRKYRQKREWNPENIIENPVEESAETKPMESKKEEKEQHKSQKTYATPIDLNGNQVANQTKCKKISESGNTESIVSSTSTDVDVQDSVQKLGMFFVTRTWFDDNTNKTCRQTKRVLVENESDDEGDISIGKESSLTEELAIDDAELSYTEPTGELSSDNVDVGSITVISPSSSQTAYDDAKDESFTNNTSTTEEEFPENITELLLAEPEISTNAEDQEISTNNGPSVPSEISDDVPSTPDLEKDQTVNLETENIEVMREISREEEPRKEFLLASSAREGNIYIWRAGTDGRLQTFLTVPNKSNRRSIKSNGDKVWIVLCWVTPTMLLSSSKSAELLQWSLPKPPSKNEQFRLIHNDHSPIIFSIAAPTLLFDEYNWVEEKKLNAWTIGQDRLLLNTSLTSDRKSLGCYPTLGKADSIAQSPLDPNRLAIGTGVGIIKTWDLSRPHVKNIVMHNFYQKILSKVVTLAWHPTNELLLAFGTVEGRIGYIDVNNRSKLPTLLQMFFKSHIHKIEWGPVNGNTADIGLFVVSEGKLVVFTVNKFKSFHIEETEPFEIDTPDNTFVYTFAWKPDYSILLVSTKAGIIIKYSRDLKIQSTEYLQHKLQQIYWHPEAVLSDLSLSKYCHWCAAICNYKSLIVFDFGINTDTNEERIVFKYESYGDAINCVAWSPHGSSNLVIGREDGIAEVWNVESNTALATFTNSNFEGILTVVWSPCDPDYIILTSKDHTIKIWKISDFPVVDKTEVLNLRKKVVKEISSEAVDLVPKIEKTPEEPVKVKKSYKNNLLPNFCSSQNTSDIVSDLWKLFLWKENLSSEEIGADGDHESNILHFFGSHADMLKIIDIDGAIHKQKGKYNFYTTLSLFKGDISTSIREAISEKRVNPWIIMMAPMVSPKLWQTACEVYAEQLSVESDSDPLDVATFYLICHKVEEAINVLCEGAMFKEALALAKCRLLSNDAIITDIIEKWAKYSLHVGNFERAAQCYIYLGNYSSAASILFRRSDVEVLKLAVKLAEYSGNQELYKAVSFRYNAFKNDGDSKEEEDKLPSKVEAFLKENVEIRMLQINGNKELEVLAETNGHITESDKESMIETEGEPKNRNFDEKSLEIDSKAKPSEDKCSHNGVVTREVSKMSEEESDETEAFLKNENVETGIENNGHITEDDKKNMIETEDEPINRNFDVAKATKIVGFDDLIQKMQEDFEEHSENLEKQNVPTEESLDIDAKAEPSEDESDDKNITIEVSKIAKQDSDETACKHYIYSENPMYPTLTKIGKLGDSPKNLCENVDDISAAYVDTTSIPLEDYLSCEKIETENESEMATGYRFKENGNDEFKKELNVSTEKCLDTASTSEPSEDKCNGNKIATEKEVEGNEEARFLSTEDIKKLLSNTKLAFLQESKKTNLPT